MTQKSFPPPDPRGGGGGEDTMTVLWVTIYIKDFYDAAVSNNTRQAEIGKKSSKH